MTNIRRSVVKRLVRVQMKSPPVARLSAYCLNLMGYHGYKLANLADQPGTELAPVFDASESQVAGPRALGADVEVLTRPIPPIRPIVFNDVTARTGSSFLHKGHKVLLPDEMYTKLDRISLLTNSGFFFQDYFVTKHDKTADIPKGICAFGHGDTNWYHWLAEILPVISLSDNLPAKFDDYPLLVPEAAEKIRSFQQTLALFRGNREVVVLRDDTAYRIERLVHIASPVSGPFNMRDHMWPAPGDYTQNVGVVQHVRKTILDELGIDPDENSPKRVILVRPPRARSYNQDEIRAAAEARGFEAVQMEKLSFREQVSLMHNAEFVVGPTGAAFANTLFMKPGSQALVWALREYSGACFFSNLAHVAGCEMTYCFVDADEPVSSSYEAFAASYQLPVDLFCQHLDVLIAQADPEAVKAEDRVTNEG